MLDHGRQEESRRRSLGPGIADDVVGYHGDAVVRPHRNDGSFVIFSQPNQAKLTNIARSGRVSLNFEATEDEEQITIFTGYAEIVDRATIPQEIFDRYAEKYAQGMINIKLPRERYEQTYTEVIRVTPEKVRGW